MLDGRWRTASWMVDGERPAGPAHAWPSGAPGRRWPRPACRATVRTSGPALLPAPGATSISGITNKTHDHWALYWIADDVSGICQRYADAVPAAPELQTGQASRIDRRCELSAGPAVDRRPRRAPGRARPGPRRAADERHPRGQDRVRLARTWHPGPRVADQEAGRCLPVLPGPRRAAARRRTRDVTAAHRQGGRLGSSVGNSRHSELTASVSDHPAQSHRVLVRPELAAALGSRLPSQLVQDAGGRSGWWW